ncbi:MAG: serine hydrolase domain-containing protein [Bacteroidota bacterium]
MKKIMPLLLIAYGLFTACQPAAVQPFQVCQEDLSLNPDHPKAAAYQAVLEEYVGRGVPGTVALVYTPEDGLWLGAAGHAVLENAEPMQTCNLFYSASTAKTYHVVAALKLVEQGKLDLKAPIAQYLAPKYAAMIPLSDQIKVEQLMNHTSGIRDFIEETDHISDYFHNLNREYTTDDYLAYISDKEPLFEPGTRVYYSNTNTVVLALIMDHIYGDHAKALTDFIIEPLGLERTFYKNQAGYPAPPGAVNCYMDLYGNGTLQNATDWERNFTNMNIGHDAMLVNPYDNYRFLKALFAGALIDSALVDSMRTIFNGNDFIGLGLGIEATFFEGDISENLGHNGGSLGGAHEMRFYPEAGVYICTSANFGGFIDSPIGELFYPSGNQLGEGDNLYNALEKIAFGL